MVVRIQQVSGDCGRAVGRGRKLAEPYHEKRVLVQIHPCLIVLAVAVSVAVLLVVFRPRAERQARVANGRLVTTFLAQPGTVRMAVEAFGTVSPKETLRLVAQVPGRIVTMADEFVAGGFATAEPCC